VPTIVTTSKEAGGKATGATRCDSLGGPGDEELEEHHLHDSKEENSNHAPPPIHLANELVHISNIYCSYRPRFESLY
jgi:hypothetical protein